MNTYKLPFSVIGLVILLAIIVSACAPADAPTPGSKEAPKPAAGDSSPQPVSGESIKVGVIMPTAGPYATMGIPFNEGVSLAVEKINAAGGVSGRKLEAVFQDNQGDVQTTTALVRKMTADKAIIAILGLTPIVASQAAAVVGEQEGIVLLTSAPTRSLYKGKKYVFTQAAPEDVIADAEVQFVKRQLGWKKVGALRDPTEYGQQTAAFFRDAAVKVGLEVLVDGYQFADADLTPQLLKLKTAGVGGIMIAGGQPKVPAIILKNLDAMGWKVPVLVVAALSNPSFLDLAGPLAEGVYLESYLAYQPEAQTPAERELFAAYKAKGLPNFPLMFHANGWDCVNLVAQALAKSGPDRAKLRDALEQTKGFQGVAGTVNMSPSDHNGHSTDAVNFVRVEKGRMKFLWSPRLK